MPTDLERVLSGVRIDVARILGNSLDGRDLAVPDMVVMLKCQGPEFLALLQAADSLRRRSVGDRVTYVVNRNINFTNVCAKKCSFCAFSRTYRSDEGYLLPVSEIVRRAREAWQFGATEVCIQAGLPPAMPGDLYIRICQAVTDALPGLHVHAFSPEEISYGCQCSGMRVRDYLAELLDAGIGSLPGTSAEILDDDLRNLISPGRISSGGMDPNHLDGPLPRHPDLLHHDVRSPRDPGARRPAPGTPENHPTPDRRLHRVRSLGLRPHGGAPVPEQTTAESPARAHGLGGSEGPRRLPAGPRQGYPQPSGLLGQGRDETGSTLPGSRWKRPGGTLINESISTTAGAGHGQLVTPEELHRLIRDAGRVPAERNTLYGNLRTFSGSDEDGAHPLDSLRPDDRDRFGSYAQLTRSQRFRFNPGAPRRHSSD